MRIELSRSISYKDTEISSLEFDFDSLTGNDLIIAESNFKRSNPDGQLFGSVHMLYIASRACHIPPEALKTLSAKDFMRVINEMFVFFGNMDSQVSAPEITDD